MNASAPSISHEASRVDASPVLVRAEWESLFERVTHPHFPQSWTYGEAKRAAQGWSVDRLLFSAAGTPLALAQVLVKRVAGIPVARINRGPLFLDEPPADVQHGVLRALRRRWRFLRRGLLLLAPALPGGDDAARALRAAGFISRGGFAWGSALVDLTVPLDELRRRLKSEWRASLRKAETGGVQLRVSSDRPAIEWMLERHAENMVAKRFSGPPVDFVRAAYADSARDFVLLQAIVDGEPHAATLLSRYGRQAEYYLGWSDDAGRRASAGNFLLWNAVVEMQRAGCRALDLGGFTVADRYGQFKRGMRGTEYRLSGEWVAF